MLVVIKQSLRASRVVDHKLGLRPPPRYVRSHWPLPFSVSSYLEQFNSLSASTSHISFPMPTRTA